jgi:preprotein translocase subunit SecG
MTILFIILIILASLLLGFVVLVQNPKGGGLSGSIGGISNQFMGVKQTTDVLEKGTWIFSGVIALLCLFSSLFISNSSADVEEINIPAKQQAPAPKLPAQSPAPAPASPQP